MTEHTRSKSDSHAQENSFTIDNLSKHMQSIFHQSETVCLRKFVKAYFSATSIFFFAKEKQSLFIHLTRNGTESFRKLQKNSSTPSIKCLQSECTNIFRFQSSGRKARPIRHPYAQMTLLVCVILAIRWVMWSICTSFPKLKKAVLFKGPLLTPTVQATKLIRHEKCEDVIQQTANYPTVTRKRMQQYVQKVINQASSRSPNN